MALLHLTIMANNEKKYNRRVLREKALQILYAFELNGEGLTNLINGITSDIPLNEDKEFTEKLVNSVLSHQKEVDNIIKERLANWDMERIALIDRLLLRIGITEILYFNDIPPKVSMNEVIEIAKDFSTSNSSKFINGILDTFLNELRAEGKLNKSGRGLIDESLPKK
ncbi:MAG: transcription antitermination factor NusB [Ignavibacteriaceae bacterium]|nr:transcription antitermination factor NusB [Ignavibacteriaceae bacterium]